MAGIVTAIGLQLLHLQGVQRLDLMVYDLLLPVQPLPALPPVVIAIDDASLASLGRWPWPRTLHAQMIERLQAAGARAIGMDILFSEPDTQSPAGDAALARAIARQGHVALAVDPSQLDDDPLDLQPLFPERGTAGTQPGSGHVALERDLDGASRSLFLHSGWGQASVPALALAVQEKGPGPAVPGPASAATGPADTGWVKAQEILLPRVPDLPTLSFAGALLNPASLSIVRDRVVFIGTTASGLGAEVVSPLATSNASLPAVVFHAKAYAALSQNAQIIRAQASMPLLLALLVVGSLALWPARFGSRVLLAFGMLGLPLLVSAVLLQAAQFWLAPSLALLAMAVSLAVWFGGKLQVVNRQLMHSRQHAHATLQAIEEAVLTIDPASLTIQYANPAATLQSGQAQLLGRPLGSYPLTPDSMERLNLATIACLESRSRIFVPELLNLHSTQPMRALRATVNPMCSPEGQVESAVLVFADVTEAVATARELDHAAKHDALTGLPNRATLHERLTHTLSRVRRHGGFAALMFLDLNRFKQINDSLGHQAGDQVLKILADRLRALCRDTDTVARWGGDEFVLLLDNIAGQEGAATAAAKVVDALLQDIELGPDFNHMLLPSAGSVGVVLLPQDGQQPDDLIAKADMAMYRAKEQPHACFQFWSDDMNTRMHNRLALEIELRKSLRDELFVLHYQPQIAFAGRRLVGMEALIRWQRTDDSLVMPGGFIAAAEESDLIIDIGNWAVLHAARQVALWLRAGLQPVPVAVNVSARQCQSRDIVQVVRSALSETRIPPHLLRLEITESTAMTNADQVIGLLHEIRALGVALAVDDFGTGYSSLTYLKRFPIDELKIDRSFVHNITTDKDDAAIVRATISLAHGLGLKVVAEGIETEGQSRLLEASHCDIAQGYWFGHPQPLHSASRLLAA